MRIAFSSVLAVKVVGEILNRKKFNRQIFSGRIDEIKTKSQIDWSNSFLNNYVGMTNK